MVVDGRFLVLPQSLDIVWIIWTFFMELICIFQLITLLGQPIWRRKHEKEEQEEKTKAGKEDANRRETVKTTKQL